MLVFQDINAHKTAYYATFYCFGANQAYIDARSPYKGARPSQHRDDVESLPLPHIHSSWLLMHQLAFSTQQKAAEQKHENIKILADKGSLVNNPKKCDENDTIVLILLAVTVYNQSRMQWPPIHDRRREAVLRTNQQSGEKNLSICSAPSTRSISSPWHQHKRRFTLNVALFSK